MMRRVDVAFGEAPVDGLNVQDREPVAEELEP